MDTAIACTKSIYLPVISTIGILGAAYWNGRHVKIEQQEEDNKRIQENNRFMQRQENAFLNNPNALLKYITWKPRKLFDHLLEKDINQASDFAKVLFDSNLQSSTDFTSNHELWRIHRDYKYFSKGLKSKDLALGIDFDRHVIHNYRHTVVSPELKVACPELKAAAYKNIFKDNIEEAMALAKGNQTYAILFTQLLNQNKGSISPDKLATYEELKVSFNDIRAKINFANPDSIMWLCLVNDLFAGYRVKSENIH